MLTVCEKHNLETIIYFFTVYNKNINFVTHVKKNW